MGKKIPIKKRHLETKKDPVRLPAEFPELDPSPSNEQTAFTIQYPLVVGDKVIGYAVIKGESDQVTTLSRLWYRQRLSWILGTMLAALGVVLYLAFLFTKPVDQLVQGARQVAAGNLYVSLPSSGPDEIGRLAQTFNQMVERLRENRALQERLNEAEKLSLLGRFAATVAHEVRNSLNFINLTIDQIRAKHQDGDDRPARDLQRNLVNIKDEISRLNHLVNDVLAAGRQAPPTLVPCDLKATLTEALALVGRQARNQGIQIELDLGAGPTDFPVGFGSDKDLFLEHPYQCDPGHAGRRPTPHFCSYHQGAQRRGVPRSCILPTPGPAFPLPNERRFLRLFTRPKLPASAWGWPSPRKSLKTTRGRSSSTMEITPGTDLVVQLPFPQPSRPERAALAASPAA